MVVSVSTLALVATAFKVAVAVVDVDELDALVALVELASLAVS